MRHCIFCGDRVDSKEDAWPKWLIRLLKKSPREKAALRVSRDGESVREWLAKNSLIVVRNVCRDRCNSGWMSRLENESQPILSKMITSIPATLDLEAQDKIGQWAVKCAIMFDNIDSSGFYDVGDRRRFSQTLMLPGDFIGVWLAHYSGTDSRAFTNHRTVQLSNKAGIPHRGHIMTMLFGHLVIQVFNVKRLAEGVGPETIHITTRNEWIDSTIQISPSPSARSVSWPPRISLNEIEGSIQIFCERFILSTKDVV